MACTHQTALHCKLLRVVSLAPELGLFVTHGALFLGVELVERGHVELLDHRARCSLPFFAALPAADCP